MKLSPHRGLLTVAAAECPKRFATSNFTLTNFSLSWIVMSGRKCGSLTVPENKCAYCGIPISPDNTHCEVCFLAFMNRCFDVDEVKGEEK